jgi:hypothetical protein
MWDVLGALELVACPELLTWLSHLVIRARGPAHLHVHMVHRNEDAAAPVAGAQQEAPREHLPPHKRGHSRDRRLAIGTAQGALTDLQTWARRISSNTQEQPRTLLPILTWCLCIA